jgi:hypothetical protein
MTVGTQQPQTGLGFEQELVTVTSAESKRRRPGHIKNTRIGQFDTLLGRFEGNGSLWDLSS